MTWTTWLFSWLWSKSIASKRFHNWSAVHSKNQWNERANQRGPSYRLLANRKEEDEMIEMTYAAKNEIFDILPQKSK